MPASDRPLDPQMAGALGLLPPPMQAPLGRDGIVALREAVARLSAPVSPAPGIERTDVLVPGEHPVPLRVHRPRAAAGPLPGIYWMHSGGFIFGRHRDDDATLQRWAEVLQCVVVTVEYRLAPEHPYPAAIDDCHAGVNWTHDHAEEIGLDPARLGIAGRSAGGGLAAALSLRIRDEGRFTPVCQALLMPMLDDRRTTASSKWSVPPWHGATNTIAWQCYLGERFGGEVPADAAPARATKLSGLPPTYISIGGSDLFVDEAMAYALALNHAGVATDVRVYGHAPHGFDLIAPAATGSQRSQRDFEDWVGSAL